jgi:hypothetical protein
VLVFQYVGTGVEVGVLRQAAPTRSIVISDNCGPLNEEDDVGGAEDEWGDCRERPPPLGLRGNEEDALARLWASR